MTFSKGRGLAMLLVALLLGACGDGIDSSSSPGNNSGGPSNDGNNDNSTGDLGEQPQADRVHLRKLDFKYNAPSIISLLFQASSQNSVPNPSLTIDKIEVLEDNSKLSQDESLQELKEKAAWNYVFNTVIMVDTSASVSEDTLGQIKASFTAGLQNESWLMTKEQVALYSFDENVTLQQDFTDNAAQLTNAFEGLQGGVRSTDLYGAIITGAKRWAPAFTVDAVRLGAVIVITDGKDTAARHRLEEVTAAIGNRPVYILALGNEIDVNTLKLLTSGRYKLDIGTSAEDISNAVNLVRAELKKLADSYYLLEYASPKRRSASGGESASNHEFKMQIIGNKNNGGDSRIIDTFNAYNFTNVSPIVTIDGPRQCNIGTCNYTASTTWANAISRYEWNASSNGVCAIDYSNTTLESPNVTLNFYAPGLCSLSVKDVGNGLASTLVNISSTVNQ